MSETHPTGSTISRRGFLTAAAGATFLGGLTLAGCGRAQATTTNSWPTLVFAPDPELTSHGNTEIQLVTQFLQSFEQQNHVHIKLAPGMYTPAAILGGAGADVIWNLNYPPFLEQGLLLDLTPYLKTDSIATSIWPSTQMAQLQVSSGTYALPYNLQPMVYYVNYSDFDQAGLAFPDASWTFDDFLSILKQLKTAFPQRPGYTGADIMWQNNYSINNDWVFHAFGGSTVNATSTQVTIANAAGINAGNWVYQEVLWPGIGSQRGSLSDITNNTTTMELLGTWQLLSLVSDLPSVGNWGLLPFPIGPLGKRYTYAVNEFYGINATTAHPDVAWTFLKWISIEPAWQQFLMKLVLLPPAINSLWPEWAATVSQAAPPFAHKGLHWFTDAIQSGYAIPQVFFAYDNSVAASDLNQWYTALGSQSITDVATAFTSAENQINPILTAAANSPAAKIERALQSTTAGGSYAAPSQTGLGTPAIAAGSLIQSSSGTYTLTGTGWDVWSLDDACTFAAAAQTASTGTWTVQITSLSNLNEEPGLSEYAAAGLMARQDLSSDAAFVAVSVSPKYGITVSWRYAAGDNPEQTLAATVNPKAKTGLIGPAYLLRTGVTGTGNVLQAPVWLQLRRKETVWTAWTSPDNHTWTQAGGSIKVLMAGAWIGAYATAGNVGTGNTGETQAVFKNLSVTPTQLVQLGAQSS